MKYVNTGRFEGAAGHARIGAQSSDGIEQLAAVSNKAMRPPSRPPQVMRAPSPPQSGVAHIICWAGEAV
jgi:hypothetical protein